MTNAQLLARREHALPRGISTATPIFAARAENAELWDVDGRRYIDFVGGIAVLGVGHRHPRVVSAVRDQLECYTHTAFQVCGYEPYVELAERLNALAPFTGEAKTILFTTGAEAVENAVKIARAATKRPAVISFVGGFHGRSMLGLALTGKVAPYKREFGPLPGQVYHLPFPAPYAGVTEEQSLQALDFLFAADVPPSQVAAIVLEPVQGEGGFHVAPPSLLAALRGICDHHGILLVADEVQTGFARTGKMFAIEHSGVEPDLVTIAKSLAGGLPLAGVIGRSSVMDAAEPGGLGGTFGGSPLGCAAALAVLDIIAEEQLLTRADAIGARLRAWTEKVSARNDMPAIANVRGLGAMIGFDVLKAHGAKEPDPGAAKRIVAAAVQHGLLVLSAGMQGETIRFLPPLTITDEVLEEGLTRLEQAMVDISADRPADA